MISLCRQFANRFEFDDFGCFFLAPRFSLLIFSCRALLPDDRPIWKISPLRLLQTKKLLCWIFRPVFESSSKNRFGRSKRACVFLFSCSSSSSPNRARTSFSRSSLTLVSLSLVSFVSLSLFIIWLGGEENFSRCLRFGEFEESDFCCISCSTNRLPRTS